MRVMYVGIGDDPVGRPRTKGLVGVGAKSLILGTKTDENRKGG